MAPLDEIPHVETEKTASVSLHQPRAPSEVVRSKAALSAPLKTIDTNVSDQYGSRPKCFSTLLSECLFVLTTTFAIGQPSILNGALIVMSGTIQEDLNMNSAEITWLLGGCILTSGAFLLFFGRVADLFGRRLLLVSSMAFFTICMLIVGFSVNAVMAEVFLALSGIASAAVVPPAIGKLGAIYERPSRRKNRAFACFSAGNPLGFVIGALISGIVNQISTWRVSFRVITVMFAFLTLVAYYTTPEDSEQSLGGLNMATLKQMDWLGALLIVAGIAMFTTAFTLAPSTPNGWKKAYVLVLLLGGLALICIFLYWQSIFAYPLMPMHVWKDKNFSLLVASLCLCFYGFQGNFFWSALGWQRVYLDSPLHVAVKILPSAIGGVMINVLAAVLMHRVSNKLLMTIAAGASVGACALWSATSKSISYWALSFPAQLLGVTGGDLAFCVTNIYVMSSLPAEQQSVAGGIFQTVRRLVATIGLGVSTMVFAAVGGTDEIGSDLSWRPYQSTFWVSLVGAVLGLALTPFLTIGKQGAKSKKGDVEASF